MVKNPDASTGDMGSSSCQEDPLKKEMATHPSILAWEILWTEEPGGLQSMGSQRVRHNLVTKQQQQHNNELDSTEINIYIYSQLLLTWVPSCFSGEITAFRT